MFFLDWRCEKAASQSLSYSIFTKTSEHFCLFSSAYAKGEKFEETLTVVLHTNKKIAILP